MATINEISKKANVSIATVSKVLNGKKGVSKATVEKVLNIAKELNYRPNLTARSLKHGQSRTIGVITEDLTVFNTPEIVDGIDACCENNDYHYILGNLRFNKRFGNNIKNKDCTELVRSQIDTMLSKQVDGIIYIGYHCRAIAPVTDEVPLVYTYCYSTDPNIPSVLYDDRLAAYEATQLLVDRGHRNIGVIAGQSGSMHTGNRMLGHQEALFANNIPYNPNLTLYGDWKRDKGYELSETLINKGVTAIFAHNDIMATGVIDYCNKHGIQVGKDLALIGFDNLEIGEVSRPALSTVSLPLFEMGQTATKLLLDKLAGNPVQYGQRVMLACSLIERESTLPAT